MPESHDYELPATHGGPPVAAQEPRRRRRWLRWSLLVVGPVVLIFLAIAWYLRGGRTVSTNDASVQADTVQITSDVAGTVVEVLVRDDQAVRAGQALYRLDDEPFRIALTAAEAQLAEVRNQVDAQRETYRQRLEELAQADEDVSFSRREYDRISLLAPSAVASQEQIDAAAHALQGALRHAASLRHQAAAELAQLDGDPDLPIVRRAGYRQALAQRDQAARNLRSTTIVAPADGIVARVSNIRPGNYVQPSVPACALVEDGGPWIEANPKETDLTWLRPGQRATVRIDAYPDRDWAGSVDAVSPATGAQFALLPPQNASGNWVKVVQRVPIRVRIEVPDDAPPLRAGMSAHVTVDTGRRRGPRDLARAVGGWVGLG